MLATLTRWRKELRRRLTIMIVPHGTSRPRQFSFSVTYLLFLFAVWTLFTAWASYMASERFDYWRLKANTHVLRIKMDYFANQLKESREMLDEVREVDSQLRNLIGMGSKESIVQSETPLSENAGGPSAQDAQHLNRILEGSLADMSFQDISHQFKILQEEVERRKASYKEITKNIENERRLFRFTPLGWPVKGPLTSHYGGRVSPLFGYEEWHQGVDIGSPPGTPVRATADGTIRVASWAGGYGKLVLIDHEFGYSTLYGHNRQLLVKAGDKVKRGQVIALVGSTGNATGPHCHYELWTNGRRTNPWRFMKKQST